MFPWYCPSNKILQLSFPDIRQKFLIRYPSVSIAIVIAYILFVKWIGPAIMANRKPFELKYLMIVYDFGQVLVNMYLTYSLFRFAVEMWPYRCMVKNHPLLPLFMERILKIAWHVYLDKFADLIDTCMFVLRKKDKQISFLHVFHHALMCVLLCWGISNIETYAMGYYIGFTFSINTTVHVIVYFYYGLAAFGPHMLKYLWWKKYLTIFQMVQFTLVLMYMIYGFSSGCEEVGITEIIFCIYIVVIYALFIDFYKKYKDE
ncbi:hypothetical protein JTE90_029618 [Oedothorax gibbosus]|uniref:Elongation of very long chain fatty acids protein n=1 Tax=Oedothorax gibbosus TaxID=931172 RepID=A0AAV6VG34_9ARAC|nr:hypothetical protein JTE90_029618 [Oedothorax gibbosus]